MKTNLVLRVEVDLEELGAVHAHAPALADDLGRVDEVVEHGGKLRFGHRMQQRAEQTTRTGEIALPQSMIGAALQAAIKAKTVERVVVAATGPVPDDQLKVVEGEDIDWSVVSFDVAALADDLPEGGPLAVDRDSQDLASAISRDDACRVVAEAFVLEPATKKRFVVSNGGEVRYAFSSDAFKSLGTRIFLRKGDPLPAGVTAAFNARSGNVTAARRSAGECDLKDWFDTDRHARLDEEVIGIGRYGFTLTILSSEALAEPDDDGEEDEEAVIDRWTPRFAYGR